MTNTPTPTSHILYRIVPHGPKAWQLYTTDQYAVSCHDAAKSLEEAVIKAIHEIDEYVADKPKTTRWFVEALGRAGMGVHDAMKKWESHGACDTEPRNVAAQVLITYAKIRLGRDEREYMPELGDMLPF